MNILREIAEKILEDALSELVELWDAVKESMGMKDEVVPLPQKAGPRTTRRIASKRKVASRWHSSRCEAASIRFHTAATGE